LWMVLWLWLVHMDYHSTSTGVRVCCSIDDPWGKKKCFRAIGIHNFRRSLDDDMMVLLLDIFYNTCRSDDVAISLL
jgi:hypothetical protein